MIVKEYNYGWGKEFQLKQLEQDILDEYLKPLISSSKRIVIVNSTWYNIDHHARVVEELHTLEFDAIVIVSMIDCAIVEPSWFSAFDVPVYAVGYYNNNYDIDFWAIAVDRYFEMIEYNPRPLINKSFMNLNRKPHWHRRKLVQQLQHYNLLEHGYVSLGAENNDQPEIALNNIDTNAVRSENLAPNYNIQQNGIVNDIMTVGNIDNWNNHFINIVSETVYDINKNHFVTEKTWKPIVGYKPFFIYDPDLGGTWLESRGFETYIKDFEDIYPKAIDNPHALIGLLLTLSIQDRQYFNKKTIDLKQKVLYNKDNFSKYVRRQWKKIKEGIICQI